MSDAVEPDVTDAGGLPRLTAMSRDALAPLDDAEALEERNARKNFAKVGSQRPSSLLYTNGPGAIVDLPHFTVMPSGYDAWERIWRRREGNAPTLHAPRLLATARTFLGPQVKELRPYPRQARKDFLSREGDDLGVPARVFPQMMRCTGCDLLRPLTHFDYENTRFFRPDEARFEHRGCTRRRYTPDGQAVPPKREEDGVGTAKSTKRTSRSPAIPARYLLVCPNGHVDEFPYELWVHRGAPCPSGAQNPDLRMRVGSGGKGANATIHCTSCKQTRGMGEAQGMAAQAKLPRCRGRHPHLEGFEEQRCLAQTRLMLVGASNFWFPVTQSVIVMPLSDPELEDHRVAVIRQTLGAKLRKHADDFVGLKIRLEDVQELEGVGDEELRGLIVAALKPAESEEQRQERAADWDPVELLAPEWEYLRRFVAEGDPAPFQKHTGTGLITSIKPVPPSITPEISAVVAVDKLRKVNAFLGFTRIDELDRVADTLGRLVRLTERRPEWVVATEDRGEGVFLSLDETAVATWEDRVLATDTVVWPAHREAHVRNYRNRLSDTADAEDLRAAAERRLPPPRYWMIHALAHVLIREMALHAGYGAASLTERIYAYRAAEGRRPAAGVLIATTASDSDGTLGGLVRLSEPDLLADLLIRALRRARRCSSDPMCGVRLPHDPEDFLHVAACHACLMASETSCERANRFLDRRFLVPLPGTDESLAFFGDLLGRAG